MVRNWLEKYTSLLTLVLCCFHVVVRSSNAIWCVFTKNKNLVLGHLTIFSVVMLICRKFTIGRSSTVRPSYDLCHRGTFHSHSPATSYGLNDKNKIHIFFRYTHSMCTLAAPMQGNCFFFRFCLKNKHSGDRIEQATKNHKYFCTWKWYAGLLWLWPFCISLSPLLTRLFAIHNFFPLSIFAMALRPSPSSLSLWIITRNYTILLKWRMLFSLLLRLLLLSATLNRFILPKLFQTFDTVQFFFVCLFALTHELYKLINCNAIVINVYDFCFAYNDQLQWIYYTNFIPFFSFQKWLCSGLDLSIQFDWCIRQEKSSLNRTMFSYLMF